MKVLWLALWQKYQYHNGRDQHRGAEEKLLQLQLSQTASEPKKFGLRLRRRPIDRKRLAATRATTSPLAAPQAPHPTPIPIKSQAASVRRALVAPSPIGCCQQQHTRNLIMTARRPPSQRVRAVLLLLLSCLLLLVSHGQSQCMRGTWHAWTTRGASSVGRKDGVVVVVVDVG